ncbi:MAG: cytochrome c oxidase subunit II [bacterium]
MTRATYLRLVAAMIALSAVMSVFLLQFDWFGPAGSEEAEPIDRLFDVMVVLSSVVFSIVVVMFGYAVWRYRAKPGDESDGEPIHGNTRLEIAWTVIPTVIVLFGAGYSWVILDEIEEPAPASERMQVNVTAQQFKWTFEYPDEGVTSNELHVPVGTQLELHLTALDVLHSFWVPEWRIKRDVVPQGAGSDEVDDVVSVTPDALGTYSVICTELCGTGHSTMRAFAYVQSDQDFDAWISKEAAAQAPAGGGETGGGTAGSP